MVILFITSTPEQDCSGVGGGLRPVFREPSGCLTSKEEAHSILFGMVQRSGGCSPMAKLEKCQECRVDFPHHKLCLHRKVTGCGTGVALRKTLIKKASDAAKKERING